MNKAIHTPNAPAAIGPYSQGVAAGNTAYISGQLPIDPATGEFAGADIASQTRQSLKNMQAILAANGMTFANVVKTTIFLTDLADFATVNGIYATRFPADPPARSCVQVAALPAGAKIEMELVAAK